MSVSLQLGRAADLTLPPALGRIHGLVLASLWALALWPARAPGMQWVEAGLGLAALLAGHETLRRGLVSAFVRLAPTQDTVASAAAACGYATSLVLLSLDAAGRLPASAADPRGGPALLLAEAATVLALRVFCPDAESLGLTGAEAAREPPPQAARLGREQQWLLVLWIAGGAAALGVAAYLAAAGGGLPRLAAAAMAAAACVSLQALAAARRPVLPRAISIRLGGILTAGRPEVVDVVPLVTGARPEDVLYLAALAEYGVEHPIRDAILRRCQGRFPTVVRLPGVERLPGRGVRAKYQQREILCGNVRLFRESFWPPDGLQVLEKLVRELGCNGDTVIFLAHGSDLRGALRLADPLRPNSGKALDALRRLGLEIHVTTGDHRASAEALLGGLGPLSIHAGESRDDRDAAREAALARGDSVEFCHQPGMERAGRHPLYRKFVELRERRRRSAQMRWLALASCAYFLSATVLFTGALEPWLELPPIPVAAALMAALAPCWLSFVLDRFEIYNRRFFRSQNAPGKSPAAAAPRPRTATVPCNPPSTISSS